MFYRSANVDMIYGKIKRDIGEYVGYAAIGVVIGLVVWRVFGKN